MSGRSFLACAVPTALILFLGNPEATHAQVNASRSDAADDTSAAAVDDAGQGTAWLDRSVAASPATALRVMPGVDLAQTGMDRRKLTFRGFNDTLHGGPLVLVDGRSAALPMLDANLFALMPIQHVDLKRIEVVRGPATARYGPAARAGAVHFVTKNPFDDPGTTVATSGGTHRYASSQLRHAADVGETFGYEITAYAARGNDWRLDPRVPADRRWLAYDYTFDDPADARDNQRVNPETGQLLRAEDYRKLGIHGRLAYRLGDRTAIAAQGGYASLTGRALSEIGALQADFLGYSFAQLQLRSGALFTQFVLNNNEAGDSYLYTTGRPVVDRSVQYATQVRYRLDRPGWRTALAVGSAAHWTRPRTGGTLVGRHEERDAIDEYGAYGHAVTALSPRLDLTLALRADVDNLDAHVRFAPHAALAYELAPSHTLFLRYDRTVASPRIPSYFLDAAVQRRTLALPYDLVYRARGARRGFSFDTFRAGGEAVSLLPEAGRFGHGVPVDAIPLRPMYRFAAERFGRLLADPATRPNPTQTLSTEDRQRLAGALRDLAAGIADESVTSGELGVPQGTGGYTSVAGPVDVPPLARPVTQTVEVGYRGTLDRLRLSADAYYVRTKNAIGPLEIASPLVYTPALVQDLRAALEPAVAQRAADPDAPLGTLLEAMNLTVAEAVQMAAGLAGEVYAGTPVGVVASDRSALPAQKAVVEAGPLMTYRNYDRLQYVGADVSVRARLHESVQVFGGGSLVSDELFTARAAGETSAPRTLALNTPALEAHLGVDVAATGAWSLHGTGHYRAGFPVRAGLYAGHVEAAMPVDVGLRYDARRIAPGLHLELAVRNVLDQAYRAFAGAPALSRRARVRLTYAW